jgi:hypothetical protein
MKSRALRCLLSIVAGFATFIAVMILLYYAGGLGPQDDYHYLWGLTHRIAQRIDPAPYPLPADSTDEFFGPFGGFFDEYFGIAFWAFLFALVYFLFVFRSKPTDLTKRSS